LNHANFQPLRKYKYIFGEDAKGCPILSGHEDFPFAALPTAPEIARILSSDIGGKYHFRFALSRGSPSLDAQATMSLLQNIDNPFYNARRRSHPHVVSPTHNRLRRTTTSRQSDSLLGQAAFEITVAPASKVFDITYYDYHRVSVLLTGSRVLIALPSCIFNLSLLPYQYSSLASSQTGNIFSSTYTSFSHGIAIVQNAGETLTTPLFWCFIAFYTSISVAAEYPVATAAKYTAARTHGLVPRDNTHVAR
jgi:hypothetical protein